MKPWFLAAGIETLITLLIFVAISALSSWLKHRNAGKGDEEMPAPPQIPKRSRRPQAPEAEPARRPTSWEEELRRMLEGETPAAPAQPPPIVIERRAPEPPPLPPLVTTMPSSSASQRSFDEGAESMEGGLAVDMPELAEAASTQAYAGQVEERVEERLRQSGSFAAANAAFARASQLHELAAARMRRVTEQTPSMMTLQTRAIRSPEGARVVAMLRNRESVRTAIVASMIFGQPKALES